jgi:hypothetical protein
VNRVARPFWFSFNQNGNISGCRMDVWMCGVPVDATFHGGSNDTIGGHVQLRWLEISPICLFNFLLSLAAPHLHGLLVLVTGNKFIAGVIVTGDNCSPVSLTAVKNLFPISMTPAITENP